MNRIINLDQLKRSFDTYCKQLEGELVNSCMIISKRGVNPTWIPEMKSDVLELVALKDYAEKIVLTIELVNYDA